MKLTFVLLVAAFVHASASSYAQKVTVNVKDASLQQVFYDLTRQTGYNFICDAELVKQLKPISLSVKRGQLRDVLQTILVGQPVELIFGADKNVIIKRKFTPIEQVDPVVISGTVTDEKGETVPGVTVKIKGSASGVSTDINGKFSIALSDGNVVLQVSSIGFESQEIAVSGRKTVNIVLKQVAQMLDEVVLVGYGTTKKATLTGAITVLDMRSRENRPITNASQALQGVSGLYINQAGGKPGQDGATIRIRGTSQISNANSEPMVLVDGIEYPINEINPDFIENVTVLKDAAAAIYGSRGANGVILITTKTGKKGRTDINYSASYGIQQPTALPDVVWDPIQYMQLKNQALINEGKSATAVDYSPAQITEYQNGMATNPYAYPNINWFDYMLKNGNIQQHNLSFSGGTDKVLFNIGVGYMDQDGILIKANHANRYTLNANISANLTSRLKVGANIVENYRSYTEPAFGGNGGNATNYYFNRLTRVLPIFTPYTPDGKWGSVVFATPGRNTIENPLMLLSEGRNVRTPNRMLSKVYADYKLPANISYNITFGIDRLDGYASVFTPYIVSYHPITGVANNYNVNPNSYEFNENAINMSFYHTLTWNNVFAKKHHVNAMLGHSYDNRYAKSFYSQIEGYFDNSLTDLSAGSLNPTTSGTRVKDVLLSYFSRVNYTFDDKYIIEGIIRYDGSSRFAEGHKWSPFPSASAAWRIDREGFFKSIGAVNLLKLRGSWGKMGNQSVPQYSYLSSVRLGSDYTFNNVVSPGASVNAYADPDISWESTTTTNIGLDAEAFGSKLVLTLDVFKKRTSGILRPVGLPSQVGGLTGPQKNIGVVDNMGYDLNLTHRNKISDFGYEITGGLSFLKNKVVNLDGETIISGKRIIKEGFPIDSYYIYLADGIYQNQAEVDNSAKVSTGVRPGYLKYKDINNDKKIDGNDRVITGQSVPKYTYNFNINLSYKNIGLTSFFQGIQGIDLYPTVNLAQPFNNGAGVTQEWVNESWTPTNTGARLPIMTTATGAPEMYSAANSSSFWLQSGSYLRLKSLQLRYDFNPKLIKKLAMSKLSVFANAENVLTFTSFKGFDPEKDIKGDTFYEYPTLKTYNFGLRATF